MAKKPRDETAASNGSAPSGTTSISIQGIAFDAPIKFTEGHTLTAPEAAAFNQTFAENLRNNFASRIKKWQKENPEATPGEAELSRWRAEFADYAASYEFSGKRQSRIVDPIENEANKLARAALVKRIKEQGKDVKTIDPAKLAELVSKLVAREPGFRAEAQRRLAAASQAVDISIDDL